MNEQTTPLRRITVIDDEPAIVAVLRELLVDAGYEVSSLPGTTDLAPIRATCPDLLIVDQRLGPDSLPGDQIVALLRADAQLGAVPVILCAATVSGVADPDAARPLDMHLLPKPFSIHDLVAAVEAALAASTA